MGFWEGKVTMWEGLQPAMHWYCPFIFHLPTIKELNLTYFLTHQMFCCHTSNLPLHPYLLNPYTLSQMISIICLCSSAPCMNTASVIQWTSGFKALLSHECFGWPWARSWSQSPNFKMEAILTSLKELSSSVRYDYCNWFDSKEKLAFQLTSEIYSCCIFWLFQWTATSKRQRHAPVIHKTSLSLHSNTGKITLHLAHLLICELPVGFLNPLNS